MILRSGDGTSETWTLPSTETLIDVLEHVIPEDAPEEAMAEAGPIWVEYTSSSSEELNSVYRTDDPLSIPNLEDDVIHFDTGLNVLPLDRLFDAVSKFEGVGLDLPLLESGDNIVFALQSIDMSGGYENIIGAGQISIVSEELTPEFSVIASKY